MDRLQPDLQDFRENLLKMGCKGIAMGNAINEVKKEADLVIGSNDEDGIAKYLAEVYGE